MYDDYKRAQLRLPTWNTLWSITDELLEFIYQWWDSDDQLAATAHAAEAVVPGKANPDADSCVNEC